MSDTNMVFALTQVSHRWELGAAPDGWKFLRLSSAVGDTVSGYLNVPSRLKYWLRGVAVACCHKSNQVTQES